MDEQGQNNSSSNNNVNYKKIYDYVCRPFNDPFSQQSIMFLTDNGSGYPWRKHDTIYKSPETFSKIKRFLIDYIPSDVANIVMGFYPIVLKGNTTCHPHLFLKSYVKRLQKTYMGMISMSYINREQFHKIL